MPISNLAKVFGPTIVGYSTDDMDAMRMVQETRMQQNVIFDQLYTVIILFIVKLF